MLMTGLLLIAASLAATMDAQTSARRAPLRTQCEVAWAYAEMEIARLGRRPFVFAADSPFLDELPSGPGDYWMLSRNGRADRVAGPPAALVAALTDQNMIPSCPSIGRRLTARRIRYGGVAVQWAMARRPSDDHGRSYRAAIISISLPAVSADGRRAVLGLSTVYAPLGGGGQLIHLVRDANGRWREAGFLGLWIS